MFEKKKFYYFFSHAVVRKVSEKCKLLIAKILIMNKLTKYN